MQPGSGSAIADNHPIMSTVAPLQPFFQTITQQFTIPPSIGSWKGHEFLDTGSSYMLLNEKLWLCLRKTSDALNPWTVGPIYLADGGACKPLGWGEVEIIVQKVPPNLPVTVLGPQIFDFQDVLGLNYLCLSGLENIVGVKGSPLLAQALFN